MYAVVDCDTYLRTEGGHHIYLYRHLPSTNYSFFNYQLTISSTHYDLS